MTVREMGFIAGKDLFLTALAHFFFYNNKQIDKSSKQT